jgi:hypothetical protein
MTRRFCHQHQRSCKGQGPETVETKLPACINKASNGNYYYIALQKYCMLKSNFLFCLFFWCITVIAGVQTHLENVVFLPKAYLDNDGFIKVLYHTF